MLPVFNAIGKLALTNSTVLIIGESGTGKELVAESLHLNSNRSKNPFVALNTPAIPKELLSLNFLDTKRVLLQEPIVEELVDLNKLVRELILRRNR